METLASVFATLVFFVNMAFPKANLSQALGVVLDSPQTSVLSESDQTTDTIGRTSTLEVIKVREEAREKREELKSEFEAKREEAKEKRKESREEFKTKLAELRDEKKKEIVERIDEKLSTLNSKWVDRWNKVLERLTEVLAKIKLRTSTAKANGKDTSAIETAIASAEKAITDAQEAVNVQAGKNYVIIIGDEEGIGQDVRTTINQFHADIRTTKEAVSKAKEAVKNVFQSLKTIVGEGEEAKTERETNAEE